MTTADLHTLTGAYAVHALPEDERAEFERHLTECAACAQEVRELSETALRLGLAEYQTPPPEMRERVLGRLATVRQEPPAGSRAPGGGRPGPRWRKRTLPGLTLAACLVAAALGGVAVWQHQVAQDAQQHGAQAEQRARQQSQDMARVLAAPDAKTVRSSELPGGGRGTVVVSDSRNQAAIVTSGMSAPPSGKVYQLWFDDGGTMRSAGLMDTSGSSSATLLKGRVDGASGMGITVEPAGGSSQPTSDPVALLKLPA